MAMAADQPTRSPLTPSLSHSRSHGPPSVANATSLTQLRNIVGNLQSRHAAVTGELDDALDAHTQLVRQLSRLDLARARLGTLSNSARSLSNTQLAPAAATATKLSDAVSRLDTEQERVKATLAVVEQVSELKACVLGVVGSMGALQDWETAAEYISRASKIPKEVVESGFAEDNVPTAEVPEPPATTLDEAAKSLCRLFLKEFDAATQEGDGAKITRFFKMFPLIGRSKEGLDAYGRYVTQGVAIRARGRLQGVTAATDGFGYVNALTKLFEHIAQVVDGHSPLVQRHYGAGTMIKVIQHLHVEAADVQGGIILDTWNDERTIDRKLTDVKSYAYNFLVQSFLPAQRNLNPQRTSSPAPGAKGRPTADPQQDDGIEMKDIDQVLSEITSMLSHWSLYVRFISSRSSLDDEEQDNPESGMMIEESELPALKTPDFLLQSNLPKKVSRFLIEPFNHFSTFFLRRSVEKAFQLEEKPSDLTLDPNRPLRGNPPFITSAVDDVMYMVNQVLQRSLATSQAAVVSSTIASISRILGGDFIGMTQRKMRDESYPKAAIQGARPPEDKVLTFLVLMNNLDVAVDYLKRIVKSHLPDEADLARANGHGPRALEDLFPMGDDALVVKTALTNMETTFSAKATALVEDGSSVLFSHVLQPLMRPYLADIFRDADYSIDEDEDSRKAQDDSDDEGNKIGNKAHIGWLARMKPLKRMLTEKNTERLVTISVSYLGNLLEKRIWTYHGKVSELGGVRLESDVADICNAILKGESFRMRESFARCLQIVSVMNMEDDEWEEVIADEAEGNTNWALKDKELRRARTMINNREP